MNGNASLREGRRDVVVGIAELAVSTNPNERLITYSLGSCIGLTLFDPVAGVGGMIHCMLPLSKLEKDKAARNPAMFTDTGTVKLLNEVLKLGAKKGRLIAKLAGASSLLDDKQLFRIGERNYAVVRKVLWKNDILVAAEECGGCKSRTLSLYMDDGRVTVRSKGVETDL